MRRHITFGTIGGSVRCRNQAISLIDPVLGNSSDSD